jgi:hypothetical protein
MRELKIGSRRGDFFGSLTSMSRLAAKPVADHARLLPLPGMPGLKAARGIGTPEARFFVSGVGVETGIS